MTPMPVVSTYMTSTPITIGLSQTLAEAHEMFHAHRIRHLPVMDGGKLVGLVSQGDVRLIESLAQADPKRLSVGTAMSPHTYTVAPSAPLDNVLANMAEQKLGSAVVVDHGDVVGIFTAVDALRACSELLRK